MKSDDQLSRACRLAAQALTELGSVMAAIPPEQRDELLEDALYDLTAAHQRLAHLTHNAESAVVHDGETGWRRIGRYCSVRRRSLWFRADPGCDPPRWLELCAGREGDDAFVHIDDDGSQQFRDLLGVLDAVRFAGES